MTSIFDDPKIGDVLHAYRTRYHISQKTLASRLGVMPTTVQGWEEGLSHPSVHSMVKIADELNMSLKEVYALCKK